MPPSDTAIRNAKPGDRPSKLADDAQARISDARAIPALFAMQTTPYIQIGAFPDPDKLHLVRVSVIQNAHSISVFVTTPTHRWITVKATKEHFRNFPPPRKSVVLAGRVDDKKATRFVVA